MVEDSIIIVIAKVNYEPLCDVKTLFGLACVLPLKWCKGCPSLQNNIIHSFTILWLLSSFVKQTYKKYIVNMTPGFPPSILAFSLSYLSTSNDKLCLTWWKEHASQVEYVAFFIGGKLYMLHVTK